MARIINRYMSFFSFVNSVWTNNCPRCRQSKLFTEPFSFSAPLSMNSHCSRCNLNFEPEPGFYFGAMFLSYIMSAFFLLLVGGLCVIYLGMSAEQMLGVIIIVGIFIYFKILRLSRSLWIHLMQRYDSKF